MAVFTQWLTRRIRNPLLTRRLEVELLERRDTPSTFDLGPANLYNAYILGNFEAHGSDIEGRVAIGGNATISSYSIGDKLPNSAGTKDSLVVGGNLDFSNGQVNNGNVNTGGAANLTSFGLPNGTVIHNVTTDFIAAQSTLITLSQTYAALPVNGTVTNSFNTLTLKGTSNTLNVFTLTANDLSNCVGLQVDVPIAADVLINVSGNNVAMSNFAVWLNGPNLSEVLFNMPDAGVLKMDAIGIPASILAPNANVKFDNGQLNGTLVAWSFNGFGQLNYFPPPTTDIQNSQISGHVFEHSQGDVPGVNTTPLANVTLVLFGNDGFTNVTRIVSTDSKGAFAIDGVEPGTYQLTVMNVSGLVFDFAVPGSLGGNANGQTIVNINPIPQINGTDYDFYFFDSGNHF